MQDFYTLETMNGLYCTRFESSRWPPSRTIDGWWKLSIIMSNDLAEMLRKWLHCDFCVDDTILENLIRVYSPPFFDESEYQQVDLFFAHASSKNEHEVFECPTLGIHA